MHTIQFNLLYTLIVAMLVLFAGRAVVTRVALLQRFSIPAPVVGGILIAVFLAVAEGLAGTRASFDMSFKDTLLLVFFSTMGLAADVRMLAKGGPKLLLFLLVCSVLIALQNAVGLVAARAMDLHPAVGLLGGSISLSGGYGTGAAYATRFTETMNLHGAMELAMASATGGLVIGGILAGPLAQFLIKHHRLAAAGTGSDAAGNDTPAADTVTAASLLNALFVVFLCLAAGQRLAHLMERTGVILPGFLFCLLLGVLIRNATSLAGTFRLQGSSVDLLGNISLSLFLVMALMSTRLLDLANVAGPLLFILVLQTVAMVAYAAFVTFRVMGSNYDAAILAAGHVGFGMGTTAVGLAVMKAVTERSGASPMAFLLVPLVGAFFTDIMNALIIQGYLTLPFFGF